ncbi:MAG: cadherin repeat domain-containing protein [Bacteroidales bacterium]
MNYNYDFGKSTCLVLSFKFWVLTIFLVFVYSMILFSQNTVYINPSNGGDPAEDGSIDHPFDSWADIGFQNNTTYLQMRGTTALGCREIRGYNNIKIGAYGTGENPVVTGIPGATTAIFTFSKAKNYVVEDITLLGHHENAPVAGIYVYGDWNPASTTPSENITIRNCEVSFCYNGFRFLPLWTDVDSILVENCVIHDIYEDGLFIDGVSESILRDLYIYRVNIDWYYGPHTQTNAPGDGIQYTGDSDNFLVERCIIDRRDTGLKFCFIHSDNANGVYKNDGIIRDCLFYPPKDSTGAESAGGAFFIGGGDSLTIERCIVYGRDRIYSTPGDGDNGGPIGQFSFDYITFHHCLFDSVAIIQTTMLNDEFHFYNNTYATNAVGTPLILTGGVTFIKNSIFALGPNTNYNFGVGSVDSTLIYQGHISTWDANLGFTDSENGDFRLTSNSVAVDKGLFLGYAYDLDSVPVPQGIRPDLGACEYFDGGQSNNNTPQISNQAFDVDENSASGTIVGSVEASDPDAGQTLTWSISSGNTNNAFSINPSNGVLSVNNPSVLNYEVISTFNLVVMVIDNGTIPLSASAAISISLNDINESPQIDDQQFAVNENTSNGTTVGTVAASDPDNGQSLNYSISSGNTNNAFSLNATNGQLLVNNSSILNFESVTQFSLVVVVTDNGTGNLTQQATITVNVNDVNEVPVIDDQVFSLDENLPSGQSVGTLVATDPDNAQTLSYEIINGNTDNAFTLHPVSGLITINNSSAVNFEASASFDLTVTVTDNGTGALSDQAIVTINLNDINEAPEISDQTFSIDENSQNGAIAGTVIASDPDAGQSVTFAISAGNTDNTFLINSNSGQITVSNPAALNFEINPDFALTITVVEDGSGNLSSQATITININDLNEVPEIEEQSFAIDENSQTGTVVGTIAASDPDDGQTLTFGITSGNPGNAFAINPATGQLTVNNPAAMNYELIQSFTLTVTVTDDGAGNLSDNASIIINLNDVNEVPIINNQSFVVEATIGNGELVGIVTASDPDQGQSLEYSIVGGNEDGAFAIDGTSGELSVVDNSVLDFISNPTYFLDVQVQDDGEGELTDQAVIAVSGDNVNLAPNIENQDFSVAENSSVGQLVGLVVANDPNPEQSLTFSITSGNTNNAFQIDAATGNLTVNNSVKH